MSKKSYIIDTSTLIENSKSIEILRNGIENDIYITDETIRELDGLKKDPRVSHIVKEVTDELLKYENFITILTGESKNKNDDKILDQIKQNLKNIAQPVIFVTNDRLLSFKAKKLGLQTEEFKDSHPYQSESQIYTGFIDPNTENYIDNAFYWKEGKLYYNDPKNGEKLIDHSNKIWTLTPKSVYQNATMELLLNKNLDIITIQSSAGYGKSLLSLASAFHWVLEKKEFKKIFIFKHHIDVGGEKLGYLPGNADEKVQPYFRPIHDLCIKLHELRPAKIFVDTKAQDLEISKKALECLPLNYIRGMNIDNAYVIVDECQNFSRQEMKVILSRMGNNVRVICTGDVEQIDSPYLNESNNGLNWVVRAFAGQPNYGHIVLRGKHSRGIICDMVRNSIL